ncbi:MAG: DUF2934 domain-containing protein [Steroidobacteraceae bacterium]
MAIRRNNDPHRASDPSPSSPSGSARTAGPAPEVASTSARTVRGRSSPPVKRRAAADVAPVRVSSEARRAMIAEAAYLRAERRGFAAGHEEDDWLAAEREVDALLSAGQSAPQ